MRLNIHSRRVLATGLRPPTTTCTAGPTTHSTLVPRPRTQPQQPLAQSNGASRPLHTTASRAISWGGLFGRKKKPASSNTADVAAGLSGDLSRAKTRQELKDRMTSPGLSASPLLASELEQQGEEDGTASKPLKTSAARNEIGTSLLQSDLQRALDPDPRSRVRWERKMVVRHVSRMLDPKGQETRDERLARTERQLLHKSMPIPTSTKKLVHLARQISGKTLEDALVQMRFSKKKMAKEVLWHLEEARDMAVVERGMGLGRVQKQNEADGEGAEASSPNAIKIETKDGRWLEITDPSRMYIDQAWVGKGIWRSAVTEYRARGRRNTRWSPSSFLSVVLKEEKTRIRQYDERLAKEAKKAPWVHLPNRPVTAQRPYYSW
ncbi:mitochondrial large ribosomal subunit [Sporothrix schenckii 1099-18]|uniref:Mitochondrial large ribosomal subunit n=1 Tax=Sporothrix schenckii 1099-18 TaxID=1397361 RepID=A0A0F2MC90_SPOSC|nr:mitochondrial large ribosomal subunit [Sporothrix schenckii 1099-18]KJR86689.1 mitochondrial large ribosomal subunit [Sporothrix schenckii 1099-18]